MKTIHKFPLKLVEHQTIVGCFDDGGIIHVGYDPQGDLCVWAEVDVHKSLLTYDIWIIGTGCSRPDKPHFFIGTVVQDYCVWHIYHG